MYIFYDSDGNISSSIALADTPIDGFTAPEGLTALFLDDTEWEDVRKNPMLYKVVNGSPVKQPYFTTIVYGNTFTITLNNPPAIPPATVDITLCDQTFIKPLTDNSVTVNIQVHPAIANQRIDVLISAPNCIGASLNIGGSETQYPIQAYTDTEGIIKVAPTQKAVLQAYYASAVSPAYAMADIMTGLGILWDVIFGKVIPTLGAQLTFTTDEQNALNDIRLKILGSIPVTLATANTVAGPVNRHYESFRDHWPVIEKATQAYAQDLADIPNLT